MIEKSILPRNLPELERQVESLEQRLTDLDINIETLWDPYECPAEALPFLAWSLSVDVWESHWPEDIKREVIAKSPELHRFKGTPKAVKLALTQLGFTFEYSEWWENGAEPGTFDITAFINRNLTNSNELLGKEALEMIRRLIDNNKRGTAHYTFHLGLGLNGDLGLAAGLEPVKADFDHTLDCGAIEPPEVSGGLTMTGTTYAYADGDTTIDMDKTPKDTGGTLYLSGAYYQHQTLDISM